MKRIFPRQRRKDCCGKERNFQLKGGLERLLQKKFATEREWSRFVSFIRNRGWELYLQDYMRNKEVIRKSICDMQLSISNLKKGEYCDLELEYGRVEGVSKIIFSIDPLIGLKVEYDGNKLLKIVGTPSQEGVHKLVATYEFFEDQQEVCEYLVEIIPNPRDLWKYTPTPNTIEYYKTDYHADCELGKKKLVAASLRGRSHAHEGKSRDDHFSIAYDKSSGWHLLVVADGAGSASYSREGSHIACDRVKSYLLEKLIRENSLFEQAMSTWSRQKEDTTLKRDAHVKAYDLLGNAALDAFRAIEQEAKGKGRNAREYATTLLLAVCKHTSCGWLLASFWIGDGGIAVYHKEENWVNVMGVSDGGEYAGQTCFLTNPEVFKKAFERVRIDVVEDFTALVLMSDGVTDPKFETDANLHSIEYWHKLWGDIQSEVKLESDSVEEIGFQLLKWMEFWSVGNHDDRTLVMLY